MLKEDLNQGLGYYFEQQYHTTKHLDTSKLDNAYKQFEPLVVLTSWITFLSSSIFDLSEYNMMCCKSWKFKEQKEPVIFYFNTSGKSRIFFLICESEYKQQETAHL